MKTRQRMLFCFSTHAIQVCACFVSTLVMLFVEQLSEVEARSIKDYLIFALLLPKQHIDLILWALLVSLVSDFIIFFTRLHLRHVIIAEWHLLSLPWIWRFMTHIEYDSFEIPRIYFLGYAVALSFAQTFRYDFAKNQKGV